MKRFHYLTCCVNARGQDIDEMVNQSRDITYRTFRKHCDGVDDFAKQMGYDVGNQRGGLRLKGDWAVSFCRSFYKGKKCYYICHSCIEYIWV